MSKLEETKTFIDFLKVMIVTLLVGLFSMISFVVVNIETINLKQGVLALCGIVFITAILIFLIKMILNKIKSLRDM